MNKAEFIDAVAEKSGLSKKDTKGAVDAVLETLTETLTKGESVAFIGFGTFNVKQRAARTATVPSTGKKVEVAATKAVGFKVGKELKEKVATTGK